MSVLQLERKGPAVPFASLLKPCGISKISNVFTTKSSYPLHTLYSGGSGIVGI